MKNNNLKDEIVEALNSRFGKMLDNRLGSFKVELKNELMGEMNRRFDQQGVLMEDMQDKIDILAEGQEMLHERIDRVQDTVSRIEAKVEQVDGRLISVEMAR